MFLGLSEAKSWCFKSENISPEALDGKGDAREVLSIPPQESYRIRTSLTEREVSFPYQRRVLGKRCTMARNMYVFQESKMGKETKDIMRPIKQSGTIPPLYMEGLHKGSTGQRHFFWNMIGKPSVNIPPLYVQGIHGGTVGQRHFMYMMYKKATIEIISRAHISAGKLERMGEQSQLSIKNTT